MKLIVDLIYGTKSKKRRFEAENNIKVIVADASKGMITAKNSDISRGPDWIASQRAVIMLTDESIVCGKWIIPIDKISKASLVRLRSVFGGGQVLKIETVDGDAFQFGMQLNDQWQSQTVLELTMEKGKMKTSLFSWLIRLFAIGYLIYLLLEKTGRF